LAGDAHPQAEVRASTQGDARSALKDWAESFHHISTTRGGQNGVPTVNHGHPKMRPGLRKHTIVLLAGITLDTFFAKVRVAGSSPSSAPKVQALSSSFVRSGVDARVRLAHELPVACP
jgi:hypothetical protein